MGSGNTVRVMTATGDCLSGARSLYLAVQERLRAVPWWSDAEVKGLTALS